MECQARSNGRVRIRWNQWKENQWFRPNDQVPLYPRNRPLFEISIYSRNENRFLISLFLLSNDQKYAFRSHIILYPLIFVYSIKMLFSAIKRCVSREIWHEEERRVAETKQILVADKTRVVTFHPKF